MIREYRGLGPYYDCAESGNVLTIAGSHYNLNDLQEDSQRVIDITVDGMYAANIVIPPAVYKEEVIDDVETQVLQPVDADRVKIILWTKPEGAETNDNDN